MRIPVFVSGPTMLSPDQAASRAWLMDQLTSLGLEDRALGRSDYPVETPLTEVLVIARKCSGGMILGYTQLTVESGTSKPGTPAAKKIRKVNQPTPWNQLEAGILFGLRLPLVVFCDEGVTGGVFDAGTSEMFIHRMPYPTASPGSLDGVREVLLRWQAKVRSHYYDS